MVAQRVQDQVRLARHASTKDFFPALAALASSVQNIFFSSLYTIFNLCVPMRPATWAGSRAGPPVSECVSPATIVPVYVIFILHSCLCAPIPSIEFEPVVHHLYTS